MGEIFTEFRCKLEDEERYNDRRKLLNSNPPAAPHTEESQESKLIHLDDHTNIHSLLLLADSALPLGSFAFSSGLESLLAHRTDRPKDQLVKSFIVYSVVSVARLSLPFLIQAHRNPSRLLVLDNDFDASTPCTVARRASVAQGRALLTVWEKSFKSTLKRSEAVESLSQLSARLRETSHESTFDACGHLPAIFGAVMRAFDIEDGVAAYVFLLNHAKAVLSAAVRAGVLGPFQAQSLLTHPLIRGEIDRRVRVAKQSGIKDAGQVWLSGDIFMGRHEILYSRIFNS